MTAVVIAELKRLRLLSRKLLFRRCGLLFKAVLSWFDSVINLSSYKSCKL